MAETKLGRVVLIPNEDPQPNEAPQYYRVWVEDEFGANEEALFLTPTEMERIRERTAKNKEDWGKRGFFQDLLD